MAMTDCKECGTQISSQATKCPKCGVRLRKPKRGFFGTLFKWTFILFNILMLIWLIAGLGGAGDVINNAGSEAEQVGASIGAAMGATLILTIWVIGDVILGLFVLFTRPKD